MLLESGKLRVVGAVIGSIVFVAAVAGIFISYDRAEAPLVPQESLVLGGFCGENEVVETSSVPNLMLYGRDSFANYVRERAEAEDLESLMLVRKGFKAEEVPVLDSHIQKLQADKQNFLARLASSSALSIGDILLARSVPASLWGDALYYYGFQTLTEKKNFENALNLWRCAGEKYYNLHSMTTLSEVYSLGSEDFVRTKIGEGYVSETTVRPDQSQAYFWKVSARKIAETLDVATQEMTPSNLEELEKAAVEKRAADFLSKKTAFSFDEWAGIPTDKTGKSFQIPTVDLAFNNRDAWRLVDNTQSIDTAVLSWATDPRVGSALKAERIQMESDKPVVGPYPAASFESVAEKAGVLAYVGSGTNESIPVLTARLLKNLCGFFGKIEITEISRSDGEVLYGWKGSNCSSINNEGLMRTVRRKPAVYFIWFELNEEPGVAQNDYREYWKNFLLKAEFRKDIHFEFRKEAVLQNPYSARPVIQQESLSMKPLVDQLRVFENESYDGWKTYTNASCGYTFMYPPDWTALPERVYNGPCGAHIFSGPKGVMYPVVSDAIDIHASYTTTNTKDFATLDTYLDLEKYAPADDYTSTVFLRKSGETMLVSLDGGKHMESLWFFSGPNRIVGVTNLLSAKYSDIRKKIIYSIKPFSQELPSI